MTDHLDPLTISVAFADSTVASGGELDATLLIANETSETIVDPSCQIGAASYGLVPADQPGAEAWLGASVDCEGPRAMAPGYTSERTGWTYFARTRFGDPLPPGDYLAVLDIEGRTSRLLYPITVTE